MKKIGVILSGCGYLDGAEIRESVLTLWALDKVSARAQREFQIVIMAPNQNQFHVVNHLTGSETTGGETRNMLVEAARIARGKISDLSTVDPTSLDALILPGGFGVAKNLCDFAFKGAEGKVLPVVADFITKFHQSKKPEKPLGAICIAPALMALLLGKKGLEVTVGQEQEAAQQIKKTGASHFAKGPKEIHHDKALNVISTPAYMYDNAPLHEIAEGIEELVSTIIDQL